MYLVSFQLRLVKSNIYDIYDTVYTLIVSTRTHAISSYLYAGIMCSGNRPELPRCAIFKGLTSGFWATQAASQTSIINSTYFSMTSPESRSAPLKFATIPKAKLRRRVSQQQFCGRGQLLTKLGADLQWNHLEQYRANDLLDIWTTNTADWLKRTTWGNVRWEYCCAESCGVYGVS